MATLDTAKRGRCSAYDAAIGRETYNLRRRAGDHLPAPPQPLHLCNRLQWEEDPVLVLLEPQPRRRSTWGAPVASDRTCQQESEAHGFTLAAKLVREDANAVR